MNTKAYIFVWFVASCAVALLLAVGLDIPSAGADLAGILSFASLAILSEVLSLDFVVGRRDMRSSVVFIPVFACSLVFSPLYACGVAAASTIVTQIIGRVKRPSLGVFNVSQQIISFGLAALVYQWLGGHPGRDQGTAYLPFAVMASTYFVLNVVLISALVSIRGSLTFSKTLVATFGPSGGNLLYDLLSSPIAILAAMLYSRMSAAGLLVLALPILLLRYSYSSKLQLERVNKDLLRVLVKAIETRDPYTSGHSIRVSTIARMLATDVGLPRRAIDELETAALLHDIGKIEALYASVISKPHDLSAEEKALIRTHASQGADILLSLSAFRESAIEAVRHHHERYDGTGYPDGLRGEEIPLAARIIMVADSIDAMLSDRPYRNALALRVVEAELIENAGTQFDPALVDVIFKKDTLTRVVREREAAPSPRMLAVAT